MPYLIIDGDNVELLSDGETLGEVSKDAVVYTLEQPVAEFIEKLLKRNQHIAGMLAGVGQRFENNLLPLLRDAFWEGAEAQSNVSAKPLDEDGFPALVSNPYEEKIAARNELRTLSADS